MHHGEWSVILPCSESVILCIFLEIHDSSCDNIGYDIIQYSEYFRHVYKLSIGQYFVDVVSSVISSLMLSCTDC